MALADKAIRDVADRIIRDSLRHAEHLRGLLAQVVPELVNGFQFEHLRPLEREFPLEDWRHREADLPLEIPYRLGDETIPALVVVLLEHQSDTDPMMPLRLLYFAVVYWDQQWRTWEEARRRNHRFGSIRCCRSWSLPGLAAVVLESGRAVAARAGVVGQQLAANDGHAARRER